MLISLCMLCVASTVTLARPPPYIQNSGNANRVPGKYLVIVSHNDISATKQQRIDDITKKINEATGNSPALRVENGFSFQKKTILQVSTDDEELIKKLFGIDDIVAIEADADSVSVDDCTYEETYDEVWHLSRIAQRSMPDYNDAVYAYDSASDGTGTFVYIIDTGIMREHDEFEGRIEEGYTVKGLPKFEEDTDLHGHGTHVTGLAIGKTFGVAKKARAIPVKVVDRRGRGKISDFVEGIEWVIGHFQRSGIRAVASISLNAGGVSASMDEAVRSLISAGIPTTVSASNNAADACNFSPAGVVEAIVVGAMNINDTIASFSSYGSCVDIFAPGDYILSSSIEVDESVPGSGNGLAQFTEQGGIIIAKPNGIMVVKSGIGIAKPSGIGIAKPSGIGVVRASGIGVVRASGINIVRTSGVNIVRTSGINVVHPSGVIVIKPSYEYMSGTSQATPQVAGALLRQMSKSASMPTVAEAENTLLSSATPDVLDLQSKPATSNRLLYADCFMSAR